MARSLDEMLEVERRATVNIVRFLAEEIFESDDAETVGEKLREILAQDEDPRLVLDLENLGHVSSVMLSELVESRQLSEDRGGRIALAQLNPRLKDLFETVRIDILFETYLSVEAAVAALLD